jgi:hypothetical protein
MFNARLADRFHGPGKIYFVWHKTLPLCRRSLWQAQEEIAMGFRLRWQSCRAVATAPLLALIGSHAALASQGPGGGPGTASPSTQLVMAIVVYGSAALLLAAGLIGALKRRL